MQTLNFPIVNLTWSSDQHGVFACLQEACPGVLGVGPGQSIVDWLASAQCDHGAPVAYDIAQAIEQGRPFHHEIRILCADLHVRHVLVTGIPRWPGRAGPCHGAIVDLAVLRRAGDNLVRNETEHRLIIEHSDDLIAYSGPDGRYLHVSPSYSRLMGWRPEQMVGRPVIDFLHPDDVARAHAALDYLVCADAAPIVIEVRKRNAAGDYVPLSTKACPVTDRATGRIQGVALVSRDITHEQQMRWQLQEMAREKLALIESINDGFFSINAEWRITYVNKRAAAFVGAACEDVLGKVVWDVAPGLSQSAIGAHLRQAMATGQSMSFEEFYEPNGVWLGERIYAYADGLSVFFHDISERKAAEAKLEELATRDSLTGLPNRAWINQRVDSMLAELDTMAQTTIFFIDLNRFKQINDSMGHAAGDILLQQVGQRLTKCMRPGDVVARLGGDEFVVAARCAGRDAAVVIAQRLLTELKTPFHADGLEMRIGASIGICQAAAGAVTASDLFRSADSAMYKAKGAGSGVFEFFEPSMSAQAQRRLQLETSLHKALERGEFEVHYQPRIDLRNGHVIAVEALLRWTHPKLGLIPPLEFIPLAEERGQMEAIGSWVLKEACRTIRACNDRFGLDLRVSVNISACQLCLLSFVDQVLDILKKENIHPASIELEVTESALMVDPLRSAESLCSLKQAGFRLALDDFGTGTSSISYLRQMQVDVLKLDHSFVNQDPHDAGLISALIGMAHALGLQVVAEGIETNKLGASLQAMGCDQGQGYLFAQPMSLRELENYLASMPNCQRRG